MSMLTIGIIAGAILLLVVICAVFTYNSLVKSRNKVEKSFADVDVILKKRYDLIPNLVNSVKGYMKHEKETLTQVTNLRTSALQAKTTDEKVKINNEITSTLGNIVAVAENYPNLKADTSFLSLHQSLRDIENELSGFRLSYNECVTNLNTKIQTFPNNMFAKMFGFKKAELFVIVDPKERENVKVEF